LSYTHQKQLNNGFKNGFKLFSIDSG